MNLYAVPFSNDSAKIESIQKESVECMTTFNKWAVLKVKLKPKK